MPCGQPKKKIIIITIPLSKNKITEFLGAERKKLYGVIPFSDEKRDTIKQEQIQGKEIETKIQKSFSNFYGNYKIFEFQCCFTLSFDGRGQKTGNRCKLNC